MSSAYAGACAARNGQQTEAKIHGDGLFAGKNYKKGDVIYKDVFPYKGKDDILFNPVSREKFHKYILMRFITMMNSVTQV